MNKKPNKTLMGNNGHQYYTYSSPLAPCPYPPDLTESYFGLVPAALKEQGNNR